MTLRDALLALADTLTPLSAGTGRSYRFVCNEVAPPEGAHADRAFYFDDVARTTLLEVSTVASRVEYSVPLVVGLRASTGGMLDQVVTPAEVGSQFARAIEAREQWPEGVEAIIVEGVDILRSEDNERDAQVVISLSVTVVED